MQAHQAKLRLACACDVLAALRVTPELPIDEDLARLLQLAARSPELAACLATVRDNPAAVITIGWRDDEQLLRQLRSIGLDWSKFCHLAQHLVAAIDAVDAFAQQEPSRV